MVAPDVEIDDGKGTIIISSEEGETEGTYFICYKIDPDHEKLDTIVNCNKIKAWGIQVVRLICREGTR